jgi:autotransporter-associated beta strand protein
MAVIDKLNNANALNLASSWSGSVFPGVADLARWNFNAVNNVSTGLIASGTNGLSVGAIQWTSVQQNVTTISSGTAGPITLNGYSSGSSVFGLINNGAQERFDCQVNIPTAQTWSIGNGANTLVDVGFTSANGFLSGSGDIIKTGATGSLRFFRTNPLYTGNIYIDEGDVMIGAVGATAGSGIIYLNRNNNPIANSQIGGYAAISPTIANTIIANGNFSLQANSTGNSNGTGTVTYSGPLQITATSSINLNVPAGAATITGAVSGNVNLSKIGTGALNLNNANPNLRGILRLVAGSTTTNNTGSLKNTIIDYRSGDTGIVSPPTNYTVGGWSGDRNITLTVNPANFGNDVGLDATYTGVMGGTVTTTKVGTNRQVLAGNNTRTGQLYVNGGTLSLQHANAAGNTASEIFVSSNGELELFGGITLFSKPLYLGQNSNYGTLTSVSGNNTYSGVVNIGPQLIAVTNPLQVLSASINVKDSTLTLSSALSSYGTSSAVVSFDKIGTGTLELKANSTFVGTTYVISGSLKLSAQTPISGTLICDAVGDNQDITFGNITRIDIPKYDGGENGIKVINLDNSSGVGVDFHTYEDPNSYVPTFTGKGTYYKHGTGDIDLRNKTTTNISVEAGSMIADATTIFSGSNGANVSIKASLQTIGLTHMLFPNNLTFANNATIIFG